MQLVLFQKHISVHMNNIARPDNVDRYAKILVSDLYLIQLLSICYLSVQFVQFFFSAFHGSSSIDKPRLSPVSFVKTTESYKVSSTNLI